MSSWIAYKFAKKKFQIYNFILFILTNLLKWFINSQKKLFIFIFTVTVHFNKIKSSKFTFNSANPSFVIVFLLFFCYCKPWRQGSNLFTLFTMIYFFEIWTFVSFDGYFGVNNILIHWGLSLPWIPKPVHVKLEKMNYTVHIIQ